VPVVASCSIDNRTLTGPEETPPEFSGCTPADRAAGDVDCEAPNTVAGPGVVPASPTNGAALAAGAGAAPCPAGSPGCGECSPGDERACVGASGNCAAGRQRCGAGSTWEPCSIQPATADSCEPGDDADCDGLPNNPPGGCECQSDVRCGTTDLGACEFGISTCSGGRLGPCQGVVAPAPRDCGSSLDNDCDGSPDDSLDGVCQCVPGASELCETHGSADGIGACRAGQRTCNASTNALSSAWGTCVGAVPPAPRDCSSELDNDCNGVADSADATCLCRPGSTRSCGPAVCSGVQVCELAAGGASSQFGPCVPGPVSFPDPALDAAVRASLPVSVPANQPIDGALVARLDTISALSAGITRLDGLQCATALQSLEVSVNSISDLSPIAGLPLTFLGIVENQITDISVLSTLSQLRLLFMGYNPVANIAPLTNLPRLTELQLIEWPLDDLTLLSNQTELLRLDVSYTQVSDLSSVPLFHPKLIYLTLIGTPVSDLTPILSLNQLSLLDVQATNVDCNSPVLSQLAARVEFFQSTCPNF
jgi:hypothetical protein